jgi:hypothetical protein
MLPQTNAPIDDGVQAIVQAMAGRREAIDARGASCRWVIRARDQVEGQWSEAQPLEPSGLRAGVQPRQAESHVAALGKQFQGQQIHQPDSIPAQTGKNA